MPKDTNDEVTDPFAHERAVVFLQVVGTERGEGTRLWSRATSSVGCSLPNGVNASTVLKRLEAVVHAEMEAISRELNEEFVQSWSNTG